MASLTRPTMSSAISVLIFLSIICIIEVRSATSFPEEHVKILRMYIEQHELQTLPPTINLIETSSGHRSLVLMPSVLIWDPLNQYQDVCLACDVCGNTFNVMPGKGLPRKITSSADIKGRYGSRLIYDDNWHLQIIYVVRS